MRKRKIITSLIIITLIFALIQPFSFADVGSFDRYDSGSSSSSWSSGSDWGSSSWSSGYDSGSSYGYYDSSSGGGGSSIGFWVFLIFVFVYIITKYSTRGQSSHNPRNVSYSGMPNVDLTQSHIYANRIKEIDPNFSEEKMLTWAKDLFVKLQNAWTARDWEPMRPFESKDLFEQHKNQIQGYIDTNRINVMDRIAVNYATIYKFRQEGDRDILEIALKSTMKDYIIDATTKELLEGSKTQDRTTLYKMTFERKTGVLTKEGTSKVETTNCPNCGAPTQITSAGKCEYCGSVITIGANDWVLSGLEPLRT